MSKSTGPRTPSGKARSSKNAAKHWIQSGAILPHEKKFAEVLHQDFIDDLKPESAIEYVIIGNIVINALHRQRIDAAYTQEYSKARAEKSIRMIDDHEITAVQYWESTARVRHGDRLRPDLSIEILENLKSEIKTRGLKPDDDLLVLQGVYGSQPTEHAAKAMHRLDMLRMHAANADPAAKGDYKTYVFDRGYLPAAPEIEKNRILADLDLELQAQKARLQATDDFDAAERSSNVQEPEASIHDTLLRHRTANTRELKELLASYKNVREIRS